MTSLVIGNSSQLAHYFPNSYEKLSSRNINFDYLKSNHWDAVYITFAEQRIYDGGGIDYITTNYTYTMQIIQALLERTNKIVCYTSCELWNNLSGFISSNTSPNFYPLNHEYSISKLLLLNKILELRKISKSYDKVLFMHPFYFNSVYRSKYFLFGKIFSSIINKEQIEVSSLNIFRDIVSPKFVVEKSIAAKQDTVIGSGKLFNLRDYIKDLYEMNNLDFEHYVKEDKIKMPAKQKLIMADVKWEYSYLDLLKDTQDDIVKYMEGNK